MGLNYVDYLKIRLEKQNFVIIVRKKKQSRNTASKQLSYPSTISFAITLTFEWAKVIPTLTVSVLAGTVPTGATVLGTTLAKPPLRGLSCGSSSYHITKSSFD